MTVTRPAGTDASAELTLRVHNAINAGASSTASVAEGGVDVAALFPELWRGSGRFAYVQLYAGEQAVGSPVVIQPMLTPVHAVERPGAVPIQYNARQRVFSGVRAFVDKQAVLETSAGDIVIRLRSDVAPNHSWNFRHLVEGGYYTDVIFHRIVDARNGREPFVIQVGDPTGVGTGGPGYQIDLEDTRSLPHNFGVLSMARTGIQSDPAAPNTGGSQVFIALSRGGTAFLDGRYSTFGEAVEGADAILSIAATPVTSGDRPLDEPPAIRRAYLRDAPPIGSKPAPLRRPEQAGGR